MIFPRRITVFVLGLVVGLLAGGTLGYNYGRGASLLSNPFSKNSISIRTKIRRVGDRVLENTGRALEKSGKQLKRALD